MVIWNDGEYIYIKSQYKKTKSLNTNEMLNSNTKIETMP